MFLQFQIVSSSLDLSECILNIILFGSFGDYGPVGARCKASLFRELQGACRILKHRYDWDLILFDGVRLAYRSGSSARRDDVIPPSDSASSLQDTYRLSWGFNHLF